MLSLQTTSNQTRRKLSQKSKALNAAKIKRKKSMSQQSTYAPEDYFPVKQWTKIHFEGTEQILGPLKGYAFMSITIIWIRN